MQRIIKFSDLIKKDVMSNRFVQCIYLSLLSFISFTANSQERIYKNFGIDDGLPSSEVFDTYQDKYGYIWFATDKGLSRYNGYEFENFNISDGLPGNTVLKFYPQNNGQIWCYTLHRQALFYFNQEFDGFKVFLYNDLFHENISKMSIVKSVYVDTEENVHIGGYEINGEIIISPTGEVKRHFASPEFYSDTLYRKKIILKTEPNPSSSTHCFWVFDDGNSDLNQFSFQKENIGARFITKWHIKNEVVLVANRLNVTILSKDQDDVYINNIRSPIGLNTIDNDHFFVGYEYGGGKILDIKGNIIQSFLKDQSVSSLLIDHEGGYWFSTLNSGVFYLKNASIKIFNNSVSSNEVKSLVKTKENELFVGYENGTITQIYNNRKSNTSNRPKLTTHVFVEYDDHLNKLYKYSDGQINAPEGNSLFKGYILKISEPNSSGTFLSSDQGFYKITEDSVQFYPTPYRILDVCLLGEDTLIATPLGIYRYKNHETHTINDNSLFRYRCQDLDANENTIYAATQGVGLVIMDEEGVDNIDTKYGLSSDNVNEVYIENDSTIWACTIKGLDRIILGKNDVKISSISKEDGLISNEITDIEIIKDTIWVGTKQGLCFFSKSEMNPKKIAIHDLAIKNVIINDISYKEQLKPFIRYKEDKIDLVLEGISYAHNEDIIYKYRINQNENWSTTKNRRIQFSSLAWGDYLFQAQMCIDNQNCTDNTVTYKFTVLSPVWARWWFISLCLVGIGILIYSFFKVSVLTYNKDVTRELIRLVIKKLNRNEIYFTFRENGNDVRIKTKDIIYIKSAGNYIDVYTTKKKHTIRLNIGKFLDNIPDKLEYIRLHRSYIVRIDKIVSKSINEVELKNGTKIPVSQNHLQKLKVIVF